MRKQAFRWIAGLALSAAAAVSHAQTFTVDALLDSLNNGAGTGLDTGVFLTTGESFSVSADPSQLWNSGPIPRHSEKVRL